MVQCYLMVNRVDLAETQLRTMQRADDDATITQLAASRFYLAQGGERIADALATLTDLADKYGATPALLSAQAVCAMRTGSWAEAERLLLEPEVLVNLAVCALHTGKPREVVTRYITFVVAIAFSSSFLLSLLVALMFVCVLDDRQLRAMEPNHPWLAAAADFEKRFDALAAAPAQ